MPPPTKQITLVEAAATIFPNQLRAYDRLFMIIHRHGRKCPVQFGFLKSPKNGRPARVLAETDLPKLKQWIETF